MGYQRLLELSGPGSIAYHCLLISGTVSIYVEVSAGKVLGWRLSVVESVGVLIIHSQ